MNLKIHLLRSSLVSLYLAIGFGLVALFISDKKIVHFDDAISTFIRSFQSALLTSIMKFFTFIGSGVIVAILIVIMMIFLYTVLKHRSELILFLWVVIGSALLNSLLKIIFHRARPILHRIVEANGYSFPSGHSMAAFSLYGGATFLLWRHISTYRGRILLIMVSAFLILMIGISRIYLGVHYPSDVLGGFLASGSWLASSIWFFQWYQERRAHKKQTG